jgi:hypothetical protein
LLECRAGKPLSHLGAELLNPPGRRSRLQVLLSGSRQVPLLGVKALLPVADLLPFALELGQF